MGLDFTALDRIPLQVARQDFTETQKHSHRLDKEQRERARLREAYSDYQQNIKRSGSLRGEILNGMKRGEAPVALLLKAVECISLMTGDTAIYTQAQEDALAIYGWGLGDPTPLQEELKQAQQRLKRLEAVEIPRGEEKRLQGAILAHRDYIQKLEEAIAESEGRE